MFLITFVALIFDFRGGPVVKVVIYRQLIMYFHVLTPLFTQMLSDKKKQLVY